MTLADAVFLAIRYNRNIKSAYLERVAQKFDLLVAEDKFYPDIDLELGIDRSGTTIRDRTEERLDSGDIGATVQVTQVIPTGGTFLFTWDTDINRDETDGDVDIDTAVSTWQAAFQQPLLKGGGIEVNTASVKVARFNDQSNIMSLKATLIDTVTEVINAYRLFLQAKGQVDISEASLRRTRELLERNRLLISSGRMAAVEIVQVQADVANKEFIYLSALNNLDNARLNLLEILDIDKHTPIAPVYEDDIQPIHPDLEKSIEIALVNRPDYNQALIELEISSINLLLAKNNMLWELIFDSSLQYSDAKDRIFDETTEGESWQVGLRLRAPLYGDLTRKQRLVRARTDLEQTELGLEELKNSIELEIQDNIREVESRLKQLNLARLTRQLSVQKLEIEQEKLKAGLSSNFQIVTFQNDLLNAQNAEINAILAYRNALTALDRSLGTTLDTWKIEFKSE